MVSVCMASYNGEKYIQDQNESILKQLESFDELIISDDGSYDNTCKIIKSINDSRIKMIYNKDKHGFTHNFENALMNASRDHVFLTDQDDIWLNDKVDITIKMLKDCDYVVSDCITIDDEMNVLQKSRFESFNVRNGFLKHLIRSRFLGCCMAFRKEVIDVALPFPNNDSLLEHDIWLVTVSLMYFNTFLLEKSMILYRRHSANASDGEFDKGYSLLNKIYRRVYRIIKLFIIRSKVRRNKLKQKNAGS